MTQDEDLMVKFALKWLPYGGGDEHILPEFGVTPDEFYRRLSLLVNTVRATRVDLGSRRQLVELCSLELARPVFPHARRRKLSRTDRGEQPAGAPQRRSMSPSRR
ncbi:MAG: hypothetical protein WAW17_33465 [Rhodococcus sp. (in: high G+C Gram-positive bacteria)]|uniref:hypothetical protein n=1 Tax=Rhodococcus sp. TaxID=1831 RepID=UPI003BB08F71